MGAAIGAPGQPEAEAAPIDAAGQVDVLVNNAGMSVIGVFEPRR